MGRRLTSIQALAGCGHFRKTTIHQAWKTRKRRMSRTRRKRTLTTEMTTTLPFSPMGRMGMPLLGTTMTNLWTTLTMTFLWQSLSIPKKDTDNKGRDKDKAIKNPEKAKGQGPKVRIQLAGTAKSITTTPTRSEQRSQSQWYVRNMAACGEQLIKKTGITPARLKAHYKRCHNGLDPQRAGFKRREIGLCTTLVTGGAQDRLMELFGCGQTSARRSRRQEWCCRTCTRPTPPLETLIPMQVLHMRTRRIIRSERASEFCIHTPFCIPANTAPHEKAMTCIHRMHPHAVLHPPARVSTVLFLGKIASCPTCASAQGSGVLPGTLGSAKEEHAPHGKVLARTEGILVCHSYFGSANTAAYLTSAGQPFVLLAKRNDHGVGELGANLR